MKISKKALILLACFISASLCEGAGGVVELSQPRTQNQGGSETPELRKRTPGKTLNRGGNRGGATGGAGQGKATGVRDRIKAKLQKAKAGGSKGGAGKGGHGQGGHGQGGIGDRIRDRFGAGQRGPKGEEDKRLTVVENKPCTKCVERRNQINGLDEEQAITELKLDTCEVVDFQDIPLKKLPTAIRDKAIESFSYILHNQRSRQEQLCCKLSNVLTRILDFAKIIKKKKDAAIQAFAEKAEEIVDGDAKNPTAVFKKLTFALEKETGVSLYKYHILGAVQGHLSKGRQVGRPVMGRHFGKGHGHGKGHQNGQHGHGKGHQNDQQGQGKGGKNDQQGGKQTGSKGGKSNLRQKIGARLKTKRGGLQGARTKRATRNRKRRVLAQDKKATTGKKVTGEKKQRTLTREQKIALLKLENRFYLEKCANYLIKTFGQSDLHACSGKSYVFDEAPLFTYKYVKNQCDDYLTECGAVGEALGADELYRP